MLTEQRRSFTRKGSASAQITIRSTPSSSAQRHRRSLRRENCAKRLLLTFCCPDSSFLRVTCVAKMVWQSHTSDLGSQPRAWSFDEELPFGILLALWVRAGAIDDSVSRTAAIMRSSNRATHRTGVFFLAVCVVTASIRLMVEVSSKMRLWAEPHASEGELLIFRHL